ncbi:hypothetical protein K0M31_005100 [Melipona bicolor]|uniref:Uncharacterized protein n=1 Tax=Melipona bicolor TaxID=60889 RepID=A0AA40FW55_9HYME|nr:hypothetical protein K0M31_005100 [Melipona bicolor]
MLRPHRVDLTAKSTAVSRTAKEVRINRESGSNSSKSRLLRMSTVPYRARVKSENNQPKGKPGSGKSGKNGKYPP